MKQTLLTFLFFLLPAIANAYDVEINGIYYNLIPKAKQAEVTYGNWKPEIYDEVSNGYSGDVIIPESIEFDGLTYNVKSIAGKTFCGCQAMTSVTIPQSVVSIGIAAFHGCSELKSVHISDLVSWCQIDFKYDDIIAGYSSNPLTYAHHIFLNGVEIKNLIIPNSVTSILGGTFNGCSGLSSVTIPNSVTSISSYAFYGCSGLTSVTIGNNVTTIGRDAFSGCIGLSSITIPNSVTSIGNYAFFQCSSLSSVYITNMEKWCNIGFADSFANPLFYAHHLFLDDAEINDLISPNSVTSIGRFAFYGCIGLTSITIPNSVTSIGDYSFRDCSGLTSVTIGNSVTSIGESAFQKCTSLTSVTIGNSVTSIGDKAFAECKEMTDVYCYAIKTPTSWNWDGNANPFLDSYVEYTTLHVPESAMEDYKATVPWSGFKEIVALPNFKLTYLVDGEVYKVFKYEEERKIPREPEPYKEGYTFSGWSEIPEVMPDHDVDVTGTFTINKYRLIYMVDGENYKTIEVDYGSSITTETSPTKAGYTFSGWSEIPEAMPAYDVWVYGSFVKSSLGQCAVPTITFVNGELSFSCETEDVEFFYEVKCLDSISGSGNSVTLTSTYLITVYAAKEGYDNSEPTTKEIHLAGGLSGDTNCDGVVNAADIVETVNIIMKQ